MGRPLTPREKDLIQLQKDWVKLVQPSDLRFWTVKLIAYARKREVPQEVYTVEVSEPLFKVFPKDAKGLTKGTGVFLPVTARDTWTIAGKFKEKGETVLPLTRAVADQAHLYCIDVLGLQRVGGVTPFRAQHWDKELLEFPMYTDYLMGTAYFTQRGKGLVSGAHKLWVLSAKANTSDRPKDQPKAINYGAHFQGRRKPQPPDNKTPVPPGPYLSPGIDTHQPLGGTHNNDHWDYSQLLQLMKNLKDKDGKTLDLRKALTDANTPGHMAVWDEDFPPAKDVLQMKDLGSLG